MSTLRISRDGEALLLLLVNGGGGVTGLTALVAVRDGATVDSWLDFDDGTFKPSGWATRQAPLDEVSAANAPGLYQRRLDLSAVTLPETERLVAEYSFSGGATGVAADVLEIDNTVEAIFGAYVGDYEGVSGSFAQFVATLGNRLEVNLATRKLELWDHTGTSVIQSWDLRTTGGEDITTEAGVQTRRLGRDL